MDDADLCARLRAPAYWMSGSSDGHEGENDAPLIAADAIERLTRERDEARAEVERLREAVVETDAARDVLAERQRQVSVEHWTPHHDDNHSRMELSRAAWCYILKAIHTENDDTRYNPHLASDEQYSPPYPRWEPPQGWPWESTAWKPKGTRADLVRAGALILAEIERLDRARAALNPDKTNGD